MARYSCQHYHLTRRMVRNSCQQYQSTKKNGTLQLSTVSVNKEHTVDNCNVSVSVNKDKWYTTVVNSMGQQRTMVHYSRQQYGSTKTNGTLQSSTVWVNKDQWYTTVINSMGQQRTMVRYSHQQYGSTKTNGTLQSTVWVNKDQWYTTINSMGQQRTMVHYSHQQYQSTKTNGTLQSSTVWVNKDQRSARNVGMLYSTVVKHARRQWHAEASCTNFLTYIYIYIFFFFLAYFTMTTSDLPYIGHVTNYRLCD